MIGNLRLSTIVTNALLTIRTCQLITIYKETRKRYCSLRYKYGWIIIRHERRRKTHLELIRRSLITDSFPYSTHSVSRSSKVRIISSLLSQNSYGLLGASGCGKTTILTCIVGVRNLSNGQIWVLGGNPGNKDSGIPGPRVGYMPQEISLIGEFTVTNALYYFGTINGLQNDEIGKRNSLVYF